LELWPWRPDSLFLLLSRGDSDALYHQYGVKLQNVFDTQVAYAVIKRQIGQGCVASSGTPGSVTPLFRYHPWSYLSTRTPLTVGLNTLLRIYATPILEIRASKEKEMAELQKQRAQASGEEEPAGIILFCKSHSDAGGPVDNNCNDSFPSTTKAPGDLVRRLDAINTFKKEERLKMTEDLNYWKNRPLTPRYWSLERPSRCP